MDKITHEVRLNNLKKIVEECNNRPNGTTVKEWLATNGIKEKTYYYWLRRVRRAAYEQMLAPGDFSRSAPIDFNQILLM